MTTLFETLSAINVNDKTEKKKNLTYLSWAWAWSEFKKVAPNATYEIHKFFDKEQGQVPYMYDEATGYMVMTTVTVGDESHEMWLPVMDGANKAMKAIHYTYNTNYGDKHVKAATMFDINKTLMRCLVKNLAMFGLGIYIYAGEDLPEVDEVVPTQVTVAQAQKIINNTVVKPATSTTRTGVPQTEADFTKSIGMVMQETALNALYNDWKHFEVSNTPAYNRLKKLHIAKREELSK